MNKSNIIRNVNAIHACHCFHGEIVNIDIKIRRSSVEMWKAKYLYVKQPSTYHEYLHIKYSNTFVNHLL